MPRLIEVREARACSLPLTVYTHDILLFRASGCRLLSGGDVLELLGPFLSAIVGDDGQVLSPAGSPNMVMIRARQPGRARIDLILGDPFYMPETSTLDIIVEALGGNK
jgi:hypothetical protein